MWPHGLYNVDVSGWFDIAFDTCGLRVPPLAVALLLKLLN